MDAPEGSGRRSTVRSVTERNCPTACGSSAQAPNGTPRTYRRPYSELTVWQVACGGRIAVHEGQLRFVASTEPAIDIVFGPGTSQAIPPDVEHEVELRGAVRFTIDFLAIDESRRTEATHEAERDALQSRVPAEGGDPACWAGLLCPECGAVLDGGPHRLDCPAAEPRSR